MSGRSAHFNTAFQDVHDVLLIGDSPRSRGRGRYTSSIVDSSLASVFIAGATGTLELRARHDGGGSAAVHRHGAAAIGRHDGHARIVDELQRQISDILKLPNIRKIFEVNGLEAEGSTPEAYAQQIKRDLDRWQKVVKEAGLQPQ